MPDSIDDAAPRPPRPLTRPFRTPAVSRAVTGGQPQDAVRRSGTAPFRAPFRPTPAGLAAQQGAEAQVTGAQPAAAPARAADPGVPGREATSLEQISAVHESAASAPEEAVVVPDDVWVRGDAASVHPDPSLHDGAASATIQGIAVAAGPTKRSDVDEREEAADDPASAGATPVAAALSDDSDAAENQLEPVATTPDAFEESASSSAVPVELHPTRHSSASEEWPEDVWTADASGAEADAGEFWTAGDPDLSLAGRPAASGAHRPDPAFYFPTDTDELAPAEGAADATGRATDRSSAATDSARRRADAPAPVPVVPAVSAAVAEAEWTRLTAGTPAEGTPVPLAEALEVLASRIRAGTLQASGYEPGMGDAAALTAALAAVLGVRR